MTSKRESELYAKLGASSSKAGIEGALNKDSESNFFCDLLPDVCGSNDYYSILHSDGAGTKSIAAYICYREKNDPKYMRGLGQDSLVMNIDDLACVNALDSLILSNTIGRNRRLICDRAIGEIVQGYKETIETLGKFDIDIQLSGGETADLGDLVRTVVVDSSIFARVKKEAAISFQKCQPGDVVVGLSSTGKAIYETEENSGIASNGVSLIRHALIGRKYLEKYPEILDDVEVMPQHYAGFNDLFAINELLKTSVATALLSPTRPYAPVLKRIFKSFHKQIHGVVHCTGGGQAKICKFAPGLVFEKSDLFECPAIFRLVQQQLNVPWEEMYSVFNMGHRVEIICPAEIANELIALSNEFNIDAKVVGELKAKTNENYKLRIKSEFGEFHY